MNFRKRINLEKRIERRHRLEDLLAEHIKGSATSFIDLFVRHPEGLEKYCYTFENLLPVLERPARNWQEMDYEFPEGFEQFSEAHKKQWLGEQDPRPSKVFALEHWYVSDWLGKELKERGEIVGEFLGYTIWGRSNLDLAMARDPVVHKIAEANAAGLSSRKR